MTYIAGHLDLKLTVRATDSAAAIQTQEIERLQQLVAVMTAAATHPRRLGGDATAEELALDKKRAKRVLYIAEKCLSMWGGEPAPFDEATRIAATLRWEDWWSEHERRIQQRQRYIATWCHRYGDQNGDIKWTNQALTRLTSELKWLVYALR